VNPEPTPADPATRLREAAAKIRTLLANPQLVAGPWLSLDGGDRLLRNQPGDEDQAPIYVVNEPMGNSVNAAWIALMHPGVGEALARLLETEAETWAGIEFHDGCSVEACTEVAVLALADQILGGVTR